jgi:hypothetical protein
MTFDQGKHMRDNPIDNLMLLRMNVLPPFVYDDDEGDKDSSDYVEFLAEHRLPLLAATNAYLNAWNCFLDDTDCAESFEHLLRARKEFVASFPFAIDELQSSTDVDSAKEQMYEIYTQEARLHEGKLRSLLEETRDCIAAAATMDVSEGDR